METRKARADGLLLLVALIWGFAFVAQRLGMEHLGPYGFNASRFFLGACSLLPLLLIFRVQSSHQPGKLLKGGVAAGVVLFIGSSLQQVGLVTTTAANAGFITGLYIVLVPMFGLLFGQRTALTTWFGAFVAVAGLYFLSIGEDFSVNTGDVLVLVGAGFWAGHVLLIGKLAPEVDNLRLAIVQFFVCGFLSLLVALFSEIDMLSIERVLISWKPIAFAGLLSVGVAYTLQVVAQRDAPASHAAIIMSLEAVFAALGGWLFLSEYLDARQLSGCVLMLVGMLLSQYPVFMSRKRSAAVA